MRVAIGFVVAALAAIGSAHGTGSGHATKDLAHMCVSAAALAADSARSQQPAAAALPRLRRSRLTRLGASRLRLLRCPGCGARGCAHLAPLASLSRRGTLNPALGTHGYPDCVAGPQGVSPTDLHANQMNMVCHQRTAGAALKIGCIGDSITAGAHSSGPTKTYPAQLQAMLDPSAYAVTNLGACGSTMQKNADSPYGKRPQFTTLTSQKWDIIVIMLGTNDA